MMYLHASLWGSLSRWLTPTDKRRWEGKLAGKQGEEARQVIARLYATLTMLLLFTSSAIGQTVLDFSPASTPAELEVAREKIRKATNTPVKINVGGYALAPIDLTKDMKCHIVTGSDKCLEQQFLPKGKDYKGNLVLNEDPAYKFRTIAPDEKTDRVIIHATAPGTATLIWFANIAGKAEVISEYKVIVGDPPAPDPIKPPVDNPLTKSLRAAYQLDSVAGIGNKEHLEKLEGVYLALSRSDLSTIKTQKQLTELMAASVKGAGIPDYKLSLTNTRLAIQREYLTRQGITDDSASDTKPVNEALVKQMFADLAASLNAINP